MGSSGAPAGPCEWCGGPQSWTIVCGEMFVKCKGGCTSLFANERYNFPPISEGSERLEREFHEGNGADGTLREEGGVPCEGDAARMNGKEEDELPF